MEKETKSIRYFTMKQRDYIIISVQDSDFAKEIDG